MPRQQSPKDMTLDNESHYYKFPKRIFSPFRLSMFCAGSYYFRLFVQKVTIFRMGTPWGHSVKNVDWRCSQKTFLRLAHDFLLIASKISRK